MSKTMIGLKRRKKVEGWALEIPEYENGNEYQNSRQRIADNNKLWIFALIAVVVLTVIYVMTSSLTLGNASYSLKPRQAPAYFKNPQRYSEFADKFANNKNFTDSVISARFISPGRFEIIVPGTASRDDIQYVASMAAEKIRHSFNHLTVAQVYMKSATNGALTLMATTEWQPKKSGYTVHFLDIESKPV